MEGGGKIKGFRFWRFWKSLNIGIFKGEKVKGLEVVVREGWLNCDFNIEEVVLGGDKV